MSKRILALHLPQFYETKENNEWWGEGYTEWTAVRSAKPLYEGHDQPQEPLNDYYYDLSKVETLQWQADLSQKYGVSGFVYFHYWYEGRHLLEKPCELLLAHPEIDQPFAFCWANHSWTKAWDGKDHEILVKQTYGDVKEWEEHFKYLLPFFRDPRYIKEDGRLLFVIYKAKDLEHGYDRIAYWNRRLEEEGLPHLYVVEYINTFNTSPSIPGSDAVYEDEPGFTGRFEFNVFEKAHRVIVKKRKLTDYQECDRLWELMLKKKRTYDGRAIIQGAFPRWDNSPRKGINSRVIKGATPEKFEANLKKLLHYNRQDASDIILVNAWNEWGEGAMLEPTKSDGYGYLEAIRNALAEQ